MASGRRFSGSGGRFRDDGRKIIPGEVPGGTAVTVRFSVTVRQVREDGSEVPLDGELAAALAGPAEQFAGLAAWTADAAVYLDHGEREKVIGQEGRELQELAVSRDAGFDLLGSRRHAGGHRLLSGRRVLCLRPAGREDPPDARAVRRMAD